MAPTEIDPWRGRKLLGEVHDENAFALGQVSGHAGLFSTARDLEKLAETYLNGGAYNRARLAKAERQALWQALTSREVAEDVVIHTDVSIALDDAFGEGPGVLLVSGTGSIAYGRGPAGQVARCGGWGPVFGDEGSGQWIGRRALSVVTASADGREPETALIGAVLTAAQVNEPQELVEWAAMATPAQLASLAPVVSSVAEAGDLRANAIISLAVEELVLHVRTLARELFGDERAATPVAFTGGMLTKGTTLRKRLEHRLKSAVPGAQIRPVEINAARGAVRSALRYVGEMTA